jgi:hypothetical protein
MERAYRSKRELGRSLQQTGRQGLYHLAKERVGIVAIDSRRPKELRMIENIESLDAKLQRPGVVYAGSFLHDEVSIEIPRPRERPPSGIAERTERVLFELGIYVNDQARTPIRFESSDSGVEFVASYRNARKCVEATCVGLSRPLDLRIAVSQCDAAASKYSSAGVLHCTRNAPDACLAVSKRDGKKRKSPNQSQEQNIGRRGDATLSG